MHESKVVRTIRRIEYWFDEITANKWSDLAKFAFDVLSRILAISVLKAAANLGQSTLLRGLFELYLAWMIMWMVSKTGETFPIYRILKYTSYKRPTLPIIYLTLYVLCIITLYFSLRITVLHVVTAVEKLR